MPRANRISQGGVTYHVLNRANARMTLFESDADYALMRSVLVEAHSRIPMRTLGYCIMPNHWHLLLRPREDGELSEFMRWLTVTHTQRWHAAHGTAGTGHVYQGRYKSFPIQQPRPSAELRSRGVVEGGDAVLSVLRYVERNPLSTGLVTKAQDWPHCSLHDRVVAPAEPVIPLAKVPGGLPRGWARLVNRPQSDKELAALRKCMERGCPFGREKWVRRMAEEWSLQSTLRPRGRPRKDATYL